VAGRNNLLIDQTVQGSLLRRIGFYSLACGLYFLMTLVITESLSNPRESIAETTRRCLDEAIFWAPGMMLLAPIILYDLLRVTNRLAGPIFRLRRELGRLADGLPSEPLGLREDDYWSEVAESFNQLRAEVLRLRCSPTAPTRNTEQNQSKPPLASSSLLAADRLQHHRGADPRPATPLDELSRR
jgi:hypothetical protein